MNYPPAVQMYEAAYLLSIGGEKKLLHAYGCVNVWKTCLLCLFINFPLIRNKP